MYLTLALLFSYLAEFVVFIYYMLNVSNRIYSLKRTLIISSSAYILMFLCSLLSNAILNVSLFIIVNFILIKFLFDLSWNKVLLHTTTITFAMVISEFIPLFLLRGYTYDYYNPAYFIQNQIIFPLISKSLYFIIIYPIVIMIKKKRSTVSGNTLIPAAYAIIPFMSVCIMLPLMFLWSEDYNYIKDLPVNLLIPIITALIISINILVVFDESLRIKSDAALTEMHLMLQRETDMKEYYQSLILASEDKSILVHDIKNHLHAIKTLNSENSNDAIAEYIDNLLDTPALRPTNVKSDNSFLNLLLTGYSDRFQSAGIAFNTDIRSNAVGFFTNDEITTLFCNLLDNAYEASSKTDNGFVDLTVDRMEEMHLTIIKLRNSCPINPIDTKTGSLIPTSKSDNFHHGYGMKSICKIVEKYDGAIDYHYENCIFHINISIKNQ